MLSVIVLFSLMSVNTAEVVSMPLPKVPLEAPALRFERKPLVRQRVVDRPFVASLALLGGAMAADYVSTSRMLDHGYGYETDPLYGRHPSNARLVAEGSAFYAAEVAGSYLLKRYGQKHPWARHLWLVGPSTMTVVHAECAVHNGKLAP